MWWCIVELMKVELKITRGIASPVKSAVATPLLFLLLSLQLIFAAHQTRNTLLEHHMQQRVDRLKRQCEIGDRLLTVSKEQKELSLKVTRPMEEQHSLILSIAHTTFRAHTFSRK